MRNVDKIIIHCSATPGGRDVTATEIRKWHVQGNGWKDIGYHYVVRLNGHIELGRDLDDVGAHASGHNKHSIGICYVGGLDKETWSPLDTRTKEQKVSLLILINYLLRIFPDAKVIGHNDVSKKACPCFDAKAEYGHLSA